MNSSPHVHQQITFVLRNSLCLLALYSQTHYAQGWKKRRAGSGAVISTARVAAAAEEEEEGDEEEEDEEEDEDDAHPRMYGI